MDYQVTRVALHGVAELVLAGPQYDAIGTIKLRVTPGGFGTIGAPGLRVDGDQLITPGGTLPLTGTYEELAAAAGVAARPLRDVYHDGPDVTPSSAIHVDPADARRIADAFARGDRALREFADAEPILWPEHFDLGITVDEVNYGISPGDAHIAEPYAYVGPWQPRTGPFWNAPFGAARPLTSLDDVAAFFRDGRAAL
ncbi:hypothetical protein FKR81_19075 [Lentzea tibetensis]|uniref:Uncharacterized protein n=1 Tax=Lentzea tibetensis TaxID=2591470 RepID=A0A563EST7_9PSEU|nr:hypothetical protein [Lentzea tibetensis]TWP50713.1 hypothetical protein FKR81_19075 [Lentzea tibetensis]